MTPVRVVVLSAAGCHLCENACEVVASVCAAAGVGWRVDDIADADDEVRQHWAEFVPVISVDGKVHDVFRVDPSRLRAALA